MNFSHKIPRWLFVISLLIAIPLLVKFFNSLEPEAIDEHEDGEHGGALDPDLPEIQPGDVLLFNRAKGLNRLITWFTRSRYYHVGICCAPGLVVEARPRGVVVRDLMGPDGDKRFEIIPAEKFGGREVSLAALQWAEGQIGQGYDPFNVLSIVLDRTFTCCAWNASLPNHWACGEFVATAFKHAGTELFDKPEASVVPADFEKFLHE